MRHRAWLRIIKTRVKEKKSKRYRLVTFFISMPAYFRANWVKSIISCAENDTDPFKVTKVLKQVFNILIFLSLSFEWYIPPKKI